MPHYMKKGFLIIVALTVLIQSCEKNNQQYDEFPNPPVGLSHWPVSKVTGPKTGLINQPLALEVTYPTSSGCDYVSEFQYINSENTLLVKAFGTSLQNTPCTEAAIPKKINFNFTPLTKGNYIFKFINPDNSYIIYNLTVN
jgi:hypothetical protein